MHHLKIVISALILSLSIGFSGCQEVSDDFEEIEVSSSSSISIVIPQDRYTLTSNKEIVSIKVNVYDGTNNPITEGTIKVIYPEDIKTGRDVGTFKESIVNVVNGVANFSYTAPSNLKENTEDIVFKFFHNSDSTVTKKYTFVLNPNKDQTIFTKYKLISSIEDSNITMDLNSSKLIGFAVGDLDGNLLKNEDVLSVTILVGNEKLALLENSQGEKSASLTVENINNITVSLNTFTTSGIIPISVTIKFKDANKEEQELSKFYNIIVLSGPPTAMSLSYQSTEKNQNAKFVEKWVLTVTDRYNNRVNTNPAVSMGMLAGYAKSSAVTSNAADYLYYRTFEGNGVIDGKNNSFQVNSTLGASTVFGNVDQVNDYLITFGNGYTYDVSGKWTINTNGSDLSKLDLIDSYNGDVVSQLGFAVGRNYRQDMCRDGEEWVGNVSPENGNYVIDSTGSMRLDVEYDYYLTGKDVVLWVNLIGKKNSTNTVSRVGEAKKITLRGNGIVGTSEDFGAGFKGIIRLKIMIEDTGVWLRNSNFGYGVDIALDDENTSKSIVWNVHDESQSHGITYCYGPANQVGNVYVDVEFTEPAYTGGTITLTGTVVDNEF